MDDWPIQAVESDSREVLLENLRRTISGAAADLGADPDRFVELLRERTGARPVLLDLFCKAGGCSAGYAAAGFDVIGVDRDPQPNYPFRFFQGDWEEGLKKFGKKADVIAASPPCQRHSVATHIRGRAKREEHPDLVMPVVEALERTGKPWIVENVTAGMRDRGLYGIELCGLMFGLKVFRHRAFASNILILAPPHPTHAGIRIGENGMVCVAGHGGQMIGYRDRRRKLPKDHTNKASWAKAMQIDWMKRDELAQAIPPAYTRYLGGQMINVIAQRRL